MNIVDTAEPAVVVPELVQRAPRRHLGHVIAPADRGPEVREAVLDGATAVYVELTGRHGKGREMLLDLADWTMAQRLTAWWTVCTNSKGNLHVGSGKRGLPALLGKPSSAHPRTALARVLTDAGQGQVVWFTNGSAFDLRRTNMELVSRAEALHRVRLLGRAGR